MMLLSAVPCEVSSDYEIGIPVFSERTHGVTEHAITTERRMKRLGREVEESDFLVRRIFSHYVGYYIKHAKSESEAVDGLIVKENADRDAERFVEMLPSDISSGTLGVENIPSVGVEPEGSIGLEWYGENGDFIGSFYGNGKIIYAAVYADDSAERGVADLNRSEEVKEVIRVIRDVLFGEDMAPR